MFPDRHEAGRVLARALTRYANRDDVVVFGLPRGGVPVAYEVARALSAPLDVFVVRKLGVPGNAELAMGAIASGGIRVINQPVVRALGLSQREIEAVAAREELELERRESAYRSGTLPIDPRGKVAILVDDGLATGATMRAAAEALRGREPKRMVVAVPVGARETCEAFEHVVDETICVEKPEPFFGVGEWYEDFSQTSDAEVQRLLRGAAARCDRDRGSQSPSSAIADPRTGSPRDYDSILE